MKPNKTKHPTKVGLSAFTAGLLALAPYGHAADVDVVATQLAFNATYGLNTLAADTTWTADNIYILTDRVYVPAGVTLTIEAGTKIYSTFDNQGTPADTDDDTVGTLIISRGGQIIANGCSGKPIVFDALQTLEVERGMDLPYDPDAVIGVAGNAPGKTDAGLWGGVIILGNASISLIDASNQPVRNDVIEGFTPAAAVDSDTDGFSDILEYGYDGIHAQDDADNSGVFRYVSIRHGGYNFAADNEINGLTLGGVGSGTTIDHVEVYANQDDGVEFFGGTVNTSHMVVAFCQDDCFDIDQGHSGTHQFWFALQDTTTGGDNLGEWDGIDTNDGGPKGSTTNVAASNPQIFNATFIGAGTTASDGDNGLFLDDQFNGALYNSIITDSDDALADFSSDGSIAAFANNIVGTFGLHDGSTNGSIVVNNPGGFYVDILDDPDAGNTAHGTDPLFASYTRDGSGDVTGLDPRPTALNTTVTAGAPYPASYRGAFDSINNWAAEWSRLGEDGVFGTTLIDVVGSQTAFNDTYGLNTLVADECWTSDNIYILTDRVYVPAGVTLTIEAGTKIYSTFDNQGTPADTDDDTVGTLIISRGGQIIANGCSGKPIVFDALQTLEVERGMDLPYDPDAVIGVAGNAPGKTDAGLWGGVIILGNASISLIDASNQPVRNDVIEGFTPAAAVDSDTDGFSDILEYGYDGIHAQDDADNSGVFRYVSIRHGGYNFAADNEINGLTLGGVGSGTTIDHVEVYANQDDGVEFFGGTVNTSHMVVAFCQDDCFDIDQGHSGTHQFWFALQDTTTGGDNLGEWDGIDTNDGGPKGSTTNVAASNPQIFNATFIGAGTTASDGDNGLFLDDQFNGALYNSIITDSDDALADFSSDGSIAAFANNIVGTFGLHDGSTNGSIVVNNPGGFYVDILDDPDAGNTAHGTDPLFASYTRDGSGDVTGLDPRPTALNTTVTAGAPYPASYRGAFDGSYNWANGWSKLSFDQVLLFDTDGDGTYDVTDLDDDNDGLSDAKEAEVGTDPKVADSAAFVAAINNMASPTELLSVGYFGVTSIDYTSGQSSITLRLEGSSDLGSWSDEAVAVDVDAPAGTKFYRFTNAPAP